MMLCPLSFGYGKPIIGPNPPGSRQQIQSARLCSSIVKKIGAEYGRCP